MAISMTAFSRQSSQSNGGALVWELRTVNHRFLDISIRLPDSLRALEPAVREELRERLQRGKVEAVLRIISEPRPERLNLNETLVKQLAETSEKVRQHFPQMQTDFFSLLAWPGVMETEAAQQEVLTSEVLQSLRRALDDLVQMRQREGAQIRTYIQERLDAISALTAQVTQQIPELLAAERERMVGRIAELDIQLDEQRLAQEMAIIIQKTDISEELQRLDSHCQAMTAALSEPGALGRRLDFLSQELHREANTLSSKALSVSLTHASIEMRVLIEQIREQVQNIE